MLVRSLATLLALVSLLLTPAAQERPTARFSAAPLTGTAPLSVAFTDLSAGTIESWSWDFGDGAVSAEAAPEHVYEHPGEYTVTLVVTTADGEHTQVEQALVQVSPAPPAVDFEATPTSGAAPLAVAFRNLSAGASSYAWDFGDGHTSAAFEPTHVFERPGKYTVELTAIGAGGTAFQSLTAAVQVVESAPDAHVRVTPTGRPASLPPSAGFALEPAGGTAPLEVQFQDLSTGGASGWTWDFGDGQSSNQRHPVHVYREAGSYDVTLSVTGPSGKDEVRRAGAVVAAVPQPPVAVFDAQQRIGEAPLVVQFNELCSGDVTEYLWDFGDGQTSTSASPTHTYQTPGTYSVSLRVRGPAGSHQSTLGTLVNVVAPSAPTGPLGIDVRARPAIEFIPSLIEFGGERIGTQSAPRSVTLKNRSGQALTLGQVFLQGLGANDFQFTLAGGATLPVALAPNETLDIDIVFVPATLGLASALLRAPTPAIAAPPSFLRLTGVALGAQGDDLRVNCASLSAYVDTAGDTFAPDFGHLGGDRQTTGQPIAGTLEDTLYQTQRRAPHLSYRLPLLDAGVHEVRLHFAEIQGFAEGARRFEVRAEGQSLIADLDIAQRANGVGTALVLTLPVEVLDGILDLDFIGIVGEASVAAIEVVGIPFLDAGTEDVDFGAVAAHGVAVQLLSLENRGVRPASPTTLRWSLGESGTAEAFGATWNGTSFTGISGTIDHAFAVPPIPPGGTLDLELNFRPTQPRFDVATFTLLGDFLPVELEVSGLGGHEGDPYLHVVILAPDIELDYDGDGSENVVIDGTGSHTHEPGRSLASYALSVDDSPVSSTPITSVSMDVGVHTVELEITDDSIPPRSLAAERTVEVRPLSQAPGILARYFDASGSSATSMIDAMPTVADYAETIEVVGISQGSTVGGSPFTQDVVVELLGGFIAPRAGTFVIQPLGGVAQRLVVDGNPVSGPVDLAAGPHLLSARWAIDDLGDMPIYMDLWEVGVGLINPSPLFHDLGSVPPTITGMTSIGTTAGGNLIVLTGIGFFPAPNLVLHWGSTDFYASDLEFVGPNALHLRSPAMPAGDISVSVETPRGISNVRTFTYDTQGPVPIQFAHVADVAVPNPTAGAFGPDGRFYVTSLDGRLSAIEFDADWVAQSVSTYPGVSGLVNSDTTGITFDPYDQSEPIRVYVAHGHHFQNGGSSFTGPSQYSGQVSVLIGPTFDTPIPVVTGLPASNHDHSVNALVFDDAGDLLMSVGSMTNAGVRHPNSGDLPESPLSAAIVRARFSDPNFDGNIEYTETATGFPNADQVDGQVVDLATTDFFDVYASGIRNAFDMVLTTRGRLYVTDNGPNIGFGATSTGPYSELPDPYDDDELLLIERGLYYGSPNRNRGRFDPRENVYRAGSTGQSIPHEFRQRAGWLPPSSNGLDEYRSDVFNGAMRGNLVVQRWGSQIRRTSLSEDGRRMQTLVPIDPWTGGLGLDMGPGGALLSTDYSSGRVRVLRPVEPPANGVEVADITPWRAPAVGGTRFVVAGRGFGTLADTSVSIGGQAATLTSVSPTRIVGHYPARAATDLALLDVAVTVGGQTDVHERAVRSLLGRRVAPERWETVTPQVPVTVGEVACGVIDGVLYLMGEGTPATLRFDMEARQWLSPAAQRPFVGDHHAAEVIDGQLYVVGGFQGGAEGRLQRYDPATDAWTELAPLSWAGGSLATAVIDGKIYAAGGIVNTWTVNNTAVYDPDTDVWTSLAPMPQGRNHAAFGTDGSKLWIFGGREGGNWVQNGFSTVQVYDPATDSWEDSDDPASSLAPLPFGRGGMGHAVYFEGEFFVIGGETQTGLGAEPGTNVYRRVDVYSPATNSWRTAVPMPTARHGIDPFLYDRWIFVAAGGKQAGYALSRVFEALYLP
ncbi:MAG: PKD domain-containing protein [Planctomycetota bacterium]